MKSMPFNHSRNTGKVCKFTTKLQKLQISKQTELFKKSEFKEPTEAKCLASPNRVKSSLYWNTQDKVEGRRRRRWRRRNANRHLCRFSSSAEMTKDKHCPGASVRHRLSLSLCLWSLADSWQRVDIWVASSHHIMAQRAGTIIGSFLSGHGTEMRWNGPGEVMLSSTTPSPPLLFMKPGNDVMWQ